MSYIASATFLPKAVPHLGIAKSILPRELYLQMVEAFKLVNICASWVKMDEG